ncbi:MAG TPA: hypothetical protein VJO35_00260 [Terriglobales bacterium]|nr:hypothetical protein [Terriglobales bacterium]
MNKEWHAKKRMPENPKRDQRIEWHLELVNNYARREMPKAIAVQSKTRYKVLNLRLMAI